MKRVVRWIGILFGSLAALTLLGLGWVQATWSMERPDTPLPDIRASTDPQVIDRGAYLVHHVAHCSTCHSAAEQVEAHTYDFGSPLVGGNVWDIPLFAVIMAANITPHETGIGSMTDSEIARVVRSGVGHGGRMSVGMRFGVGPMSDEDLTAIVSWLRAQAPVEARRDQPRFRILAKALSRRFQPRLDAPPVHVPGGTVSRERGEYLANGPAACAGCHTPTDPLSFAPTGPPLSGASMADPDRTDPKFEIVAPNLTPDPRTGIIAHWTEEAFVQRFRAGRLIDGSIMPWEGFRGMTEDDQRSLYHYLRSLPPVEHDTGPSRRRKGSFRK